MREQNVNATVVPAAAQPLNLDSSDFLPAPQLAGETGQVLRPALSYWQDAIKRLRGDRLGMACAFGILIMLLVGIVGPWFFPAQSKGVPYHNQQNSNAIDQGPSRAESVLITEDVSPIIEDKIADGYDTGAPLRDATTIPPVAGLRVVGVASVNSVTLEWQAVPGVSGYQIFRTVLRRGEVADVEALTAGTVERGISIAEVTNPAQISLTDGLGLDASERYAYTVLAFVDDAQTQQHVSGPHGAVLVTELTRTLKLSDAISLYPQAVVGQVVLGRAHPFGTDGLGRDVLARMIQGTRVDMLLALLVPTVAIVLGVLIGAISGLLGGKTDLILMRVVEIVDNFPDLLVFILLQVAFGKGLFSLFLALSVFSWAGFARIVRGEVLRLREIEFVQASRLLGASVMRLVLRHIGPNLLGLIIIAWSARIPGVIAAEAFLSMIGLGLEQPDPSWGSVVFDAARRLQVNPVQFFLPASMLGITLLCFYLLGNSLRDAFDPKLRGRD